MSSYDVGSSHDTVGSDTVIEHPKKDFMLEIDVDTRNLYINGKAIQLTVLELRILLSIYNGMVTQQDLISSVWGKRSFGKVRSFSTHIYRFRNKLEPFGLKDLLGPTGITEYRLSHPLIIKAGILGVNLIPINLLNEIRSLVKSSENVSEELRNFVR